MTSHEARVVGLATLSLTLAAFGLAVLPIAITVGADSPQPLGLVLAAYPAAYGLMQLPAGLAVDRFGGQGVLLVAALLMALGFAVSLSSGWGAALGRLLAGCGAGLVLTAGFDWIAAVSPATQVRRFSVFVAGWGLGLVAAGLWGLAAKLLSLSPLVIWGLPALVCLLVAALTGADRAARQSLSEHTPFRLSGHGWSALGALATASLGNLYVQIGLLSWTALWLHAAGYGAAVASGLPTLAFGLGFWGGSALSARLRLEAAPLFLLAAVASACSACVFAAGETLSAAALALAVAGIGSSVYVGPGYAWLRRAVPTELAARATALTNALAWAGSALAPLVLGRVLRVNPTIAFVHLAVTALLTGAVAFALARRSLPYPSPVLEVR
jgi:MFS family permease